MPAKLCQFVRAARLKARVPAKALEVLPCQISTRPEASLPKRWDPDQQIVS